MTRYVCEFDLLTGRQNELVKCRYQYIACRRCETSKCNVRRNKTGDWSTEERFSIQRKGKKKLPHRKEDALKRKMGLGE